MSVVLDAGALIAADRGDRATLAGLRKLVLSGAQLRTHGGVIGQAWRDGARQAQLARLLAGVEVVPLDDALGRRAGRLLALAGTSDVIDAALVVLAQDGDDIVASDVGDLEPLAVLTGRHVELIGV